MQTNKKPTRAELQRRRQQSAQDREQNRRREQLERERVRNRRSYRPLVLLVQETINTTSAKTMAPVLPWKLDSGHKEVLDSGHERVLDSLFNKNKYSDMTVFLGESKFPFPAHRVVLGTRCPYFDDLLHSGFKEDIQNQISFEKDSPQALWRVLRYIYTGDYSDEPAESLDSEGDDLELLKHLRVFGLADMFRIDGLKQLSCKKFEQQIRQHWISDTFPDCIREVYLTSNSTDSNYTRKVVVDAVVLHKELVQKRLFQKLIQEIGDFAVDLVLEMAKL